MKLTLRLRWQVVILEFFSVICIMILVKLCDTAATALIDDATETTATNSISCRRLRGDDDDNHPDRMSSLPGLNSSLLSSTWYSGYLTYEFIEGHIIHTHYVLVEAEDDTEDSRRSSISSSSSSSSTGDDGGSASSSKKPLIYWSNGGPGASSMFGLLTEIGPYLLSDMSVKKDNNDNNNNNNNTKIIPTPIYNPYNWAKIGSILVIDQPAPVGFSYCNDDVSDKSCANLTWTDELTSLNAFQALQTFYKRHPCYLKNKIDLYLTGESYAGIYIPTLARRIVQYNNNHVEDNNSDDDNVIPLRGFAVGDACLGHQTSVCGILSDAIGFRFWKILFMAGHHQIPIQTFLQLMHACITKGVHDSSSADDGDIVHHDGNFDYNNNHTKFDIREDNTQCRMMVDKVTRMIGGYDAYALYDDCTYRNGMPSFYNNKNNKIIGEYFGFMVGGGLNDYPCGGGQVMEQYLSIDYVRDAFHIVPDSSFYAEIDLDTLRYNKTEPDLTGFYKNINNQLKVLVYNGDTDPMITSMAAQNWTSYLGFTEIEEWRPWTVDGCRRMGGYVQRYEGMFDFLTIRGAGHMVPTYKGEATLTFLKAWIEGKDYPRYDPQCKRPVSNQAEETNRGSLTNIIPLYPIG